MKPTAKVKIGKINEFKNISVNPLKYPDQIFELYSVPIFETERPEIVKGVEIGSAKQTVQKGDVLLCKINPRINRVWKVEGYTDYPLIASSEWVVIRSSKYAPDYLKWSLQAPAFRAKLCSEVTGIGGSLTRAQPKRIAEYEIPLPPLAEQERIAAELDAVVATLKKRQAQLAELDALVEARFVELFGDPATNPKGYPVCKLNDLSTKVSDGVHAKPNYTTTGKPFISVVNITKGVVDFTDCKYVSEEDYCRMTKSVRPEKGDVLYTKVGTYGIPAFIDTDQEFAIYVSVCLIKPRHDLVNSRFLAYSMRLPYIKRQADRKIKGIGVPDLHLNQIRDFDIVLPSRDEQNNFVEFFMQVEQLKSRVRDGIAETQTLFDALTQKYFG